MKPRILVTSPYPQFTELVKQVSREKKLKVTIIEGILEDAARRVRDEIEKAAYEVVVSRGGTAAAIRHALDIPVVTAEFNDFDLLHALWQAKKRGEKIAYMSSAFRKAYGFDDLAEIIGFEVKEYVYRNFKEFEQQIKKAAKDGIQVVVSGAEWGQAVANSVGMAGVVIYSSHRTVAEALERAEEVISIRRRDKEYSRRLSTMIQAVDEGVVCIDDQGRILFINTIAENLLGIKGTEIIGEEASTLSKDFRELLKLPQVTAQRVLLKGAEVVINRVAVAEKKEYFGEVFTMEKVSKIQQLEQKIRRELHRKGLVARFDFNDIKTREPSMAGLIKKARDFAKVDSTLLIIGESGSGKELFAQSIHQASARNNGPFVAINCAALPKELLESELFGYEEGAFTGARKGGKPGLFELAHKGTIFLDEIGSISLELQARLLRVLQEKEVMHIGGDSVVPIDVRCLAATNEDLKRSVKEGNFRHDLYFRLNVLKLKLLPLRNRPKDIQLLAEYFLKIFNRRFSKNIKELPAEILEWMNSYTWPGNVRELENFMERMVILADINSANDRWMQQLIEEADEEMAEDAQLLDNVMNVKMGTLATMEQQLIELANHKVGGNKSELAKLLGISRTTLWKKLNSVP